MKDKLSRHYTRHRNLILYGIIGMTGASLDFVLFVIFYRYLSIPPFAASFLSVSAGIINNFFWNSRHNFKTSGHFLSRLASFYLTGLGGAVLSVLLIFFFYDLLGINPLVAKLLTIVPVVLMQFFINKKVSFSDDPNKLFRTLRILLRRHWLEVILLGGCTLIFLSAVFFQHASDDIDNMLGGKLILHGQLPYRDFFSHHVPGMYYISAIIYPFTHNDVFTFRLIFNGLLFSLLVASFLIMRRRISKASAYTYIGLASFAHIAAWSQLPVGEALIAQLIPLILLLTIFDNKSYVSYSELTVLSCLLALIPFVSLVYIFPVMLFYPYILIKVVQKSHSQPIRSTFSSLGIFIMPYVLIGILLLTTAGVATLKYDLITFNSTYYAPLVGETGGSPVRLLFNIVVHSLDQIAHILTRLLSIASLVQVSFLVGFIATSIHLWHTGKKLGAILLVALLFLIDPRINIFNAPAIESNLALLSQHGSPYLSLAVFTASIGLIVILDRRSKRYDIKLFRLFGLLSLATISLSLIGLWLARVHSIATAGSKDNYYTYSQTLKTDNTARIINQITTSHDYAWIGASDFPSQLYLQAHRATKYTFYMPWHDSSPVIRNEFIHELADQRPRVIYYKPFVHPSVPYQYNGELQDFLAKNYFTVPTQSLHDYYFINDDKALILKELTNHGYTTN